MNDLRLVFSHVRLRLRLLGGRQIDLGLSHVHELPGLLEHLLIEPDLGLLLLMFLFQFGDHDPAELLALLHLVADIHVELLDEAGDLGEHGGLLVASMDPGFPTVAVMFRSSGLTTRTAAGPVW